MQSGMSLLHKACICFLLTTHGSLALQTSPHRPASRVKDWNNNSNNSNNNNNDLLAQRRRRPFSTIPETAPGNLRRRWFGDEVPKLSMPIALTSAIVASLKSKNPIDAISLFFTTLLDEQQAQNKNDALPIAYKPFEQLNFCKDCIKTQEAIRQAPVKPFLLELTPQACSVDPNDSACQLDWIQQHSEQLRQYKLSHGAVYFKSWSLFQDAHGVQQAWQALGLTPCRDPKEVRGPTPLLQGSSTIYETLNNKADAQTHLGLHFEGIPGIMPTSALFACFTPASSGGEFLLCDGRRVFCDLDTETLAHLETKKLRPTFAELPTWISKSPLHFIPIFNTLHFELLALFTDMTKPTDDFFLDVFPTNNNSEETCLKLTTHATVPVLLHPVTSIPTWFSGMDAGLKRNFDQDNPHLTDKKGKYASETFNVRYGCNGEELLERDVRHVREACRKHTADLSMQSGDAVLLDNFTVLHGRKPFQGTRQHAVVWFLD